MTTPTSIVAYLVLFASVGFLFLFVALLIGRFLRARAPTPEKLEAYECGEPAVGSSFVQFDLRFYVVALVFLIFDVEVAFFFPWATIFGKATQLMALAAAWEAAPPDTAEQLGLAVAGKYRELGVSRSALPEGRLATREDSLRLAGDARRLALTCMADLGVFFGILLVGFAYVWNQGDLDWVRAVGRRPLPPAPVAEAPAKQPAA